MEREIKVFVTGSSGFLGSHLIKKLSKQKDIKKIYVLERSPKIYEDNKISSIKGDLDGIDEYKLALSECDYVYHLAAIATFGEGVEYKKVNLEGTKNLLSVLKNSSRIRNFVFTSTIGAVDRQANDDCRKPLGVKSKPNPTSDYGRSKIEAEKAIIDSGIPYTIIRPTWIYGQGMRQNSHINKFVTMAYAKSPLMRIGFPGKVSLIHVDDLAEALVNCIDNKKVINKKFFGVTESLSLGEIFKIVNQKISKKKYWQIKWFDFGIAEWMVGKVHSKLPLVASNLLVNYLWAKDVDFNKYLLNKNNIRKLVDSIGEVINSNICNAGYWVITGANSGIGYELAKKLYKQKRKLVLIDIKTNNIEKMDGCKLYKVDLSRKEEIENLINEIENLKIYCLINNAGIGYKKRFADMEIDEIERTVGVNIMAPLIVTKKLLRKLVENESIVVNIASSAAYNPLPGMSLYAASKAFVSSWSESLWYELRKTNKVITFSPCGTATNFQKEAGVRYDKDGKGLYKPEVVAEKIIESTKGKAPTVMLGAKSRILMLISKIIPRKINIILQGVLFEKAR